MNPLLNQMSFVVDLITVDPITPIVKPVFDAEAVEAVFIALPYYDLSPTLTPLE
jgi:hypothetical protein